MNQQTPAQRSMAQALYLLCSFLPAIGLWWTVRPLGWSLVLFAALWTLAFSDWRSFRLPNLLTLALFAAGAAFVYEGNVQGSLTWQSHAVGAVAGFLFITGIDALYRAVRKRQGMGMGDAKLLAGIGLWLGWYSLPFVLLLASVSGLIYALIFLRHTDGARGFAKLPFGTFLALAAWLVWIVKPF